MGKQLLAMLAWACLAGSAFAVTTTPVPQPTDYPVIRIEPDGDRVGYGKDAANAAAVGTAYLAAQTAATSGDVIDVNANAILSASMGKNGLRVNIAPGVVVTTDGSAMSLVNDNNTAMTFTVTGGGILRHSDSGFGHVIYQQHASSVFQITCNEIEHLTSGPSGASAKEVIWQENGLMYVEAKIIRGNVSPIYWEEGDLYVRADLLESNSSMPVIYILQEGASIGGEVWIEAHHIKGNANWIEITADEDTRIWVRAGSIDYCVDENADNSGMYFFGGKTYVQCEKLNQVAGTLSIAPFRVENGATLYLTTQKFSTHAKTTGGEGTSSVEVAGTAYFDIGEVDDSGGLGDDGFLSVETGGNCFYNGATVHLTDTKDAFTVSGGALTIQSGSISTHATKDDLVQTGGTLNVSSSVVYSPAKTSGTITRLPAWGVTPGATGLGLLDDATAGDARTTIGAQQSDADLDTWAGVTPGSGVATFLATPSSANLATAITNETGSGFAVFATSPTLTTPNIGTPSAGTLTSCTGLPISTGVSGLGTGVATFLATPDATNFAAMVTGETGTGNPVLSASPTFTGAVTVGDGTKTAPSIRGTTSNTGIYFRSGVTFGVANGSQEVLQLSTASALSISGSSFSLRSSTGDLSTGGGTVTVEAPAADTFEHRRTTNAQTVRWYRTYTDASNYERGALQTSSSGPVIAAETAGTGGDNLDITLDPAGTGTVVILGLPTSEPATVGALWNDGGTLKVSDGP